MALALQLGRRGQGQTWPNPSVGCVIVNSGRIVGQGWTASGGRPHAEPQAIAQAGHLSMGATAYVTLEPCAHYGQTPPCADALIAAHVARVVIAAHDPDPRVDGGGIAKLKAAGIEVATDVMAREAVVDHTGFLNRITKNRPFVTLKLAMTIDGRIATKAGKSKWITGPLARRATHAMRARHDAVMVGAGTLRADDPQLTVRDMGARRQPIRIVVSSDLNLPRASGMFATTSDAPVWICHGPADPQEFVTMGVQSVPCSTDAGQIDVAAMMATLAQKGLTRVFCEGGGGLASSLLAANLVDRLVVFHAGKVIGGDGLAGIAPFGLDLLANAPTGKLLSQRTIGPDVVSEWDLS